MPNFYRYPYYRGAMPPAAPHPSLVPPSLPKPPPSKPPCPKKPPKKKLDLKTLKKDTCKSLNDVECFLNNFSDTLKYIRLINLLK